MLNIVPFKPRQEARISLAGSWEAQAKIKKNQRQPDNACLSA